MFPSLSVTVTEFVFHRCWVCLVSFQVKEKQAKEQQAATSNSELDSDAPAESGPEEDTPAHKQHSHVEFVETAIVVEPEAPPPKQTKVGLQYVWYLYR